MNYPCITADLKKITENVALVQKKCAACGIDIIGVTKGFSAHPEIAGAYLEGGVSGLADSRLKNLEKLARYQVPKYLLRLPMLSEVEAVIRQADISLNSELETIRALDREALRQNKKHGVILMVELGDIREGVLEAEVLDYLREIAGLKGIRFKGIGTNLSCFGGVIPDQDNLGRLAALADQIEEELGLAVELVSGGSTSSYPLVERGAMPGRINLLRLGEIFIMGTYCPGAHSDIFKMQAEVIEVKRKPSVPTGEIGLDAFYNKPVFEDRGIRKRALLAVGRQDVDPDHIRPCDGQAEVIGASSDHLIVDVESCSRDYRVGAIMEFNLDYVSILRLMTSEYVHKVMIR